uniref:Uncharacterized protein n=1 Tax=Arundo donax TaxID=35708 RepID=A0A0A9B1C3_ARUDO
MAHGLGGKASGPCVGARKERSGPTGAEGAEEVEAEERLGGQPRQNTAEPRKDR